MAKNKAKENKKAEIIEQSVNEQEGEKETKEIQENQKPEMSKSTKITILILIAAILILTVFLVWALAKRPANDKNPIDITPEQKANTQTDSPNQSAAETNTSANATSGNTESLMSASEPQAGETEVKKADLYIIEYYFSDDPKMGEEFTVKIKIGNKGKATAKHFHWEWWPTAYDKACEGEVDSLAVGEIKKVECKYTYGGWSTYATKAIIDSKYDVDENNESNNTATKEVVPIHDQKADLYVSEYTFNHPPTMGGAFTITIKIKNKGGGDAGSFWWEWWPTFAIRACREEVDGIDAHESETVTCTYTYGGWANYATKAVVDADNDVSESDEGNNTYAQSVIPIH